MKKNNWPIKIIIISALVLIFMILFKKEIGLILVRMTSFEISHGEKGTTVKINTPIGETVVSNSDPKDDKSIGNNDLKVEDRSFYKLYWPKNGTWNENKQIANQFGVDLVVSYYKNIGQFNPNINIVVDKNIGQMSIDQYLENNQKILKNMGWEISNSQFDPKTQSGVQIIKNKNMYGGLFQIQRIVIRNGIAYVATASKIESHGQENDEMYNEMREILNSFIVL